MSNSLQKIYLSLLALLMFTISQIAAGAEPLIIQSQVKGSQEQPNVIYIMPWQGVEQIIEVKGKKRTIKLPHFKPINPKAFKEQVRFFANKQLAEKTEIEK